MMERITQSMLANNAIYGMRKASNRIESVNAQMSSGKRINFASDDPASSVDSMRLRKQLAATEQYQRNIDDANSWMTISDSAMQSVSSQYTEAKASLIDANSGAKGPQSLRAIAADLRQQAEGIMNQANATYLGRTVFAGNSNKGSVFNKLEAGGQVTFVQADSDSVTSSPVTRQINSNQKVQVNIDGNQVFGTGTVNFKMTNVAEVRDGGFEALRGTDGNYYRKLGDNKFEQITTTGKVTVVPSTLKDGKQVPDIPANGADVTFDEVKLSGEYSIDTSNNPNVMNLMLAAADMLDSGSVDTSKMSAIQKEIDRRAGILQENLSTNGAAHKTVETAKDAIVGSLMSVQSQISDVEDVDIQKMTIDMSLADMAYKSALSSTARVVQPTLLDYLR